MKKFYSFLALMLVTVSIHAQSWAGTEPDDQAYNHETVVYASVTTNLNSPRLNVAAFIDGACRASAYPTTGQTGQPIYTLNVKGDRDADQGKTISFKVYDPETGFEYLLDETLSFDGETHGYPSGTVELTLTAPLSFGLNFTEAEVGKSYRLENYVLPDPVDAQLPENLFFQMTANDPAGVDLNSYVLLNGTTLTAVKAYQGITLSLLDKISGSIVASSQFDVVQYATAINLLQTRLQVNKDDVGTMSAFMRLGNSYELVPEGSCDQVLWETEDPTILSWSERGYFQPINGGTTRMRPYILKKDQSKLVPANDGWITVTVVVPVTGFRIDYSIFDDTFKANVGDTHIYERMKQMIHVLPEYATDQTYTIATNNPELLSLTGQTTLTAKAEGMATVTLTANGADPTMAVTETVNITIVDPTTTATIQENTLYVTLTDGNPEDITARVHDNVSLNGNAANWSNAGTVSVTGNGVTAVSPALGLSGLEGTYTATAEGTTTVTINLSWPDYDSWRVSSDVLLNKTSQAQFIIKVMEQITLMGFNVAVTGAVAGQNGTITFTPQPAGATFDVNSIGVTINNGHPGDWGALLQVSKGSLTNEALVFNYTSSIPGWVNVSIDDVTGAPIPLNDPSSAAGSQFTGFEIGYPLSLDAGWQWRSNPCGLVTPADFERIYTVANLGEIRTQKDLLYNDPAWGFFGTLTNSAGILQGQCYKLNMKNPQESVLYGSSVTDTCFIAGDISETNGLLTFTLKPGWNWVGSPYLFNHKIENVIDKTNRNLDGIIIVGKLHSTTLSNQNWNGDLKLLEAGQGYIIKNPSAQNIFLSFPDEVTLSAYNEQVSAGVKAFGANNHVWQYDHSRFMNNMTMVAKLADLSQPEQYSIGAFVGDECRGEGIIEDGRAYITVHCDAGELVTFKLYNTYTGEFRLIEEGVKAQTRLGSPSAPFALHAGALVDGIQGISTNAATATETFDLSGRRTDAHQRGVNVRRMADGSLHKVIVK